jgi:alpha-L-fucosidase 2
MVADSPITFRSHPRSWQDALPLGNGRSSLLCFGGIAEEHLILGHGACWLPCEPRRGVEPSFADLLPEVRRLIRSGKPQVAERL